MAFQLGSDVVAVVDARSRARAIVRVLAGGPRKDALSKRIGSAERVARLHNLSADFLIANVAAPVREQQSRTSIHARRALLPLARRRRLMNPVGECTYSRNVTARVAAYRRRRSSFAGP